MTKASDNIFPKVTMVEGAAPASPAATNFSLYYDSADHLLKWKNSAGTVTTIATGSALSDPMTTRGDVIVRNSSNVTARLGIGTSGKVLQSDGTDISWQTPASAADAIVGQSGIGGARISGLQGSADIDVAAGSDDEFNTTDTSDPMTGWTTLGTVDAHDINSTAKSHYYVKRNGGASNSWGGIYKAWSPSAGGTVTCKLSGYAAKIAQNSEAGLFVCEASPGKLFAVSLIDYNTTGAFGIFNEIWTNVTTYSSSPGTARTLGGKVPIYFRFVYNSSTSVDHQYSFDGKVWTTLGAATNPGFTIGGAGVGVQRGGNTSTIEATFDWIRFT